MFKAIIFDLDGTLVDSYPGIHQSLNEMLRMLKYPEVDLQTVKRRVGRGIINLVTESVSPDLVEQGVDIFRASYDQTHLAGTVLLPDVSWTLGLLYERGVRMAVASNKPPGFSLNILKHLDILRYLSGGCAGPNGSIHPKPHPSLLLHVMKSLAASTDETLYVGDMTLDAETAANAHVRFALIPSGGHSREELEKVNPDYLLTDFADLLQIA